MRRKLALYAFACSAAWCQQRAPQDNMGPKCVPADLSISCRLNDKTRAVDATITNQTQTRCYFQLSVSADDVENYQARVTEITGANGPKNGAEQTLRPPNKPVPNFRMGSITLVTLGPKEERPEKFFLSALAALPEKGGKFRVSIGRKLFSPSDPLGFEPTKWSGASRST